MRKLFAPVVVLVLLAFAWLGYQASNPVVAQQGQPAMAEARPIVRWEYNRTPSFNVLNELGNDGWEAYAATATDNGQLLYFLKRQKR
jgi:hypothetical protein